MDPRQIGAVFRNRPLMLANLGYFGHMWELYAMWGWFLAFAAAAAEAGGGAIAERASLLTFAVVAAGLPGCVLGGLLSDRIGRTLTTAGLMAASGLCALLIGFVYDGPAWAFLLVALIWGATIVGDSAQFSASVTELADQRYVGTALALQLGVGFGLTIVALWAGAAVRRLDRRLALGLPAAGARAGGRRRGDAGAAPPSRGRGARRRPALEPRPMRSSLEIHDLGTGESRVVHATDRLIEAPNWSPDGRFLVFNGDGRLWRLELERGGRARRDRHRLRDPLQQRPRDLARRPAPRDQRRDRNRRRSCIYTLPVGGGAPRRVTAKTPSYWHGWSPDGATLAYCAERDGAFDIYTIPAARRRGDAADRRQRPQRRAGLHAGRPLDLVQLQPAGHMQLWRMRPDGADLERMTDDDRVELVPAPLARRRQPALSRLRRRGRGPPARPRASSSG